jgi:2-polyprenyl-3-methyl-5-hydroxy-6-metoxy-1,4-benzoquinol methylase
MVAEELITFAQLHAGKEILDLGCATGNYSLRLSSLGYDVKGADVNPRYVEIARSRGVDVHLAEGVLPFSNGSFDTVIAFEVLEHLIDPASVIMEARRVARKNVLFTTPNCGGIEELKRSGLLFEHFGDLDHKNFFTENSLKQLLQPFFSHVTIRSGDAISPLAVADFPSRAFRFLAKLAIRCNVMRPRFFSHLFVVAEL